MVVARGYHHFRMEVACVSVATKVTHREKKTLMVTHKPTKAAWGIVMAKRMDTSKTS
jgi:hypothetical protein